jgi:hypothetical protein
MSENLIRHFIAFIGTLVCGIIYWAGYVGGATGMWWPVFGIIVIYFIVYKLTDM